VASPELNARLGSSYHRQPQPVARSCHHGGVSMTAPASRSRRSRSRDARAIPWRGRIRITSPPIAYRGADLTAHLAFIHSRRTKSGLATHSHRPQSANVGVNWGMPATSTDATDSRRLPLLCVRDGSRMAEARRRCGSLHECACDGRARPTNETQTQAHARQIIIDCFDHVCSSL